MGISNCFENHITIQKMWETWANIIINNHITSKIWILTIPFANYYLLMLEPTCSSLFPINYLISFWLQIINSTTFYSLPRACLSSHSSWAGSVSRFYCFNQTLNFVAPCYSVLFSCQNHTWLPNDFVQLFKLLNVTREKHNCADRLSH